MQKLISRLIRAGIWIGGIAFLSLITLAILMPSDPKSLDKADLIIIHGAGFEDNTLMAPSIARVELAVAAYEHGLAPKLLFTGGKPADSDVSAAFAMSELAIAMGVPMEAVILEERSQSTLQNLYFAREILGEFPQKIILISHGFHLPRCWLTAKALGASEIELLSPSITYSPWYRNGLYILTREVIAWPVNMFRLALYKLGIENDLLYR